MDEEVELARGTIAVGGTRPPMVPGLGIPWVDLGVFIVVAIESLLFRPELLIVEGVFFLWMLRLYSRDYNAGKVLLCYVATSALNLSTALGGTTMTPGRYRQYRGSIE